MASHSIRFLAAVFILATLLAPAAGADVYAVPRPPAEKIGDRSEVNYKSTSRQVTTAAVDGNVVKKTAETETIHLLAEVEVSKVAEGARTLVKIKVHRFTRAVENDDAEFAVKQHDVIEQDAIVFGAIQQGQPIFTFAETGEPAPDEAIAGLTSIAGLLPTGAIRDGELVATAEPKSVGDAWRPAPALLERYIAGADFPFEVKSPAAIVRLVEVKEYNEIKHLDIELSLRAKADSAPPIAPGTEFRSLDFSVTGRALLPADGSAGPAALRVNSTLNTSFAGKPDTDTAGLTIDVSLQAAEVSVISR